MLHKPGEYVRSASFPIVFVNDDAFGEKVSEADAESYVAQAMRDMGFVTAYTKDQLATGEVAPSATGRMYANSYSPYGGWWVMGLPPPFWLSSKDVADHGVAYSYDQHVPLAFYGPAFKPGCLSRPGRADRPGADPGRPARHQQADQFDRARADAGDQLAK